LFGPKIGDEPALPIEHADRHRHEVRINADHVAFAYFFFVVETG
jgi:hypothetical protein